jgi:hypothetical protein
MADHVELAGDEGPQVTPDQGREGLEGFHRQEADVGFAAQQLPRDLDVGFAPVLDGVAASRLAGSRRMRPTVLTQGSSLQASRVPGCRSRISRAGLSVR